MTALTPRVLDTPVPAASDDGLEIRHGTDGAYGCDPHTGAVVAGEELAERMRAFFAGAVRRPVGGAEPPASPTIRLRGAARREVG